MYEPLSCLEVATDICRSEALDQARNRRLADLKFVRQAPVGPYFADFLCREHKVVVEVDGGTHSSEADARRGQQLQRMGYRVFRVHNVDIYENIDGVLDTLLTSSRSGHRAILVAVVAAPHPDPLPASDQRGFR